MMYIDLVDCGEPVVRMSHWLSVESVLRCALLRINSSLKLAAIACSEYIQSQIFSEMWKKFVDLAL